MSILGKLAHLCKMRKNRNQSGLVELNTVAGRRILKHAGVSRRETNNRAFIYYAGGCPDVLKRLTFLSVVPPHVMELWHALYYLFPRILWA